MPKRTPPATATPDHASTRRGRSRPANVDNVAGSVDNSGGDVEKPAKKPVVIRPPVAVRTTARGGKLNSGGVFAGTGRPPDAWKAEMRALADSAARAARAKKILETPDHPAWLGAWKFVAEQGYGKADQRIQHAGDADAPLTVRVVFEDAPQ